MKRGKAEKWTARSERLAASLRENLKRRKAQARGRTGMQSPAQPPDEHSPWNEAGDPKDGKGGEQGKNAENGMDCEG